MAPSGPIHFASRAMRDACRAKRIRTSIEIVRIRLARIRLQLPPRQCVRTRRGRERERQLARRMAVRAAVFDDERRLQRIAPQNAIGALRARRADRLLVPARAGRGARLRLRGEALQLRRRRDVERVVPRTVETRRLVLGGRHRNHRALRRIDVFDADPAAVVRHVPRGRIEIEMPVAGVRIGRRRGGTRAAARRRRARGVQALVRMRVAGMRALRAGWRHAFDPDVPVAPHHPLTIRDGARHAVRAHRHAFVQQHRIEIGCAAPVGRGRRGERRRGGEHGRAAERRACAPHDIEFHRERSHRSHCAQNPNAAFTRPNTFVLSSVPLNAFAPAPSANSITSPPPCVSEPALPMRTPTSCRYASFVAVDESTGTRTFGRFAPLPNTSVVYGLPSASLFGWPSR
ncbi:hypothetical protein DM50_3165 [Burkholderia mallei]|nr:hypothetical protein DM50_3165 [Burkholderia mallei]KOT10146.1 hypothetical protein DM77_2670 [Burkholderia mallei]